jgi:hypothetical protein
LGHEASEEAVGGGAGGGELRLPPVNQGHQLVHLGDDAALLSERRKRDLTLGDMTLVDLPNARCCLRKALNGLAQEWRVPSNDEVIAQDLIGWQWNTNEEIGKYHPGRFVSDESGSANEILTAVPANDEDIPFAN